MVAALRSAGSLPRFVAVLVRGGAVQGTDLSIPPQHPNGFNYKVKRVMSRFSGNGHAGV